MMNIILASASPRRRELMSLITTAYTVAVSSIDERSIHAQSPCQLVAMIAKAKCEDIAAQYPRDVIIGCDTVVDLDGRVYGKPRDKQDAQNMLKAFSGSTHLVHTGTSIYSGGEFTDFISSTVIHFSPVSITEIEAYTETAEPYDKAGGYGIQGWAAKYVSGIEGCYYNAMGFPVSQIFHALQKLNVL